MLGTLIAIVKLQSLASVLPGLGMFAFIAMLITFAAARVSFDPEIIWEKSAVAQLNSNQLSGGTPVINCHTCGLVRNHAGSEFMTESSVERITSPGMSVCERCGAAMHHRIVDSTERTAAFLLAAVTMLIPANLYPVMTVKTLGQGSPDTILSGVVRLIESGLWGLGMIVFVASIVVPCLKISVLSFLLYSVRYKPNWRPRDRTVLYRITEAIGAWSMVDVFLVGLLSGLVNLGLIASIRPGIGATFFAAAVILTIFAARSFDPRLIWDATGSEEATHWPMPQE
jgi:paraquat-inducible protein A